MMPGRPKVNFLMLLVSLGLLGLLVTGCDQGLEPPPLPEMGTIAVDITYAGQWPPADSLVDLRFVAMRFVPRDTSDFLQLNRMAVSPGLNRPTTAQSIVLPNIEVGFFFYSGVAQRFDQNLLSWRPVGLYEANDGLFEVVSGETTFVSVAVDFNKLPPFPPPLVQ